MNPKPPNVTAIAPVYVNATTRSFSSPPPNKRKGKKERKEKKGKEKEGRNDTVSNGSTANLAEFRVFIMGFRAGMGTLMDLNLGLPQAAFTFEYEAPRFKAT